MARLDSPFTVIFLLFVVVRVQSIILDDYGDVDDPGDMPQSDYPDFSSPRAPVEPLLSSDPWFDADEDAAEHIPARPELDESEPEEEQRRKRPIAKRPHVKARAVTSGELYKLFGDNTRRKKSVDRSSKSSLLRHFLKAALEQKHVSVKKKRSVHGKKAMVKRSGRKKKRAPKMRKQEDLDEENSDGLSVERLELTNALLNKENEFLTAALNEATVAQTNANNEETIREEMKYIKNAEKVEAIMNQLEKDDADMKYGARFHGSREEPDDIEETVLVTNTDVADLTQCPVVKKLATKCSRVSYLYNYEMDKDAADACDAHKICYACSSAFSASNDLCDRLFVAQAHNLCQKEEHTEKCQQGALQLLQKMQETHPGDMTDDEEELSKDCRNPCVKAYFKGVYRSRR